LETIYSEKHKLRDSKTELYGGMLVYPFERPSRAEYVLARVKSEKLGTVSAPDDFGMAPILAIHDANYVRFLETAWQEWKAAGFEGEAIASSWPARRTSSICPTFIDGKIGYYASAGETSISEGTWEAACASAQTALTGAARIQGGAKSVFSLCRPPGHHAALDMFGGYCFFNNAAIAAQSYLDAGAKRVAILDVDFHHGNGTQDIFYTRDDVLFLSLHGDPKEAFPYFLGHAEETGSGKGDGFNVNYPMPRGTTFKVWREALLDALDKIKAYAPDIVVVSLGLDTFENDPISFFKLATADFVTYGADIATLGLPTHFILEGGYDIAELGVNAVNVLQGFEGG
jgi:acetoin utilization deacetylase AcuC-like enzyme